jgi:hypothetical protein
MKPTVSQGLQQLGAPTCWPPVLLRSTQHCRPHDQGLQRPHLLSACVSIFLQVLSGEVHLSSTQQVICGAQPVIVKHLRARYIQHVMISNR